MFCAIDASISCTALSILKRKDGKDNKFELIDKISLSTKNVKFPNRWEKKIAMFQLYEKWLSSRVDLISFFVFENYSYGSPGQLADLGELNGLYKKFISDHKKPMDVIAPTSVKKIIAGTGRASKLEVAEAVLEYLESPDLIKFNNLDESDSVAIGISYAISMTQLIDSGGVVNEQE